MQAAFPDGILWATLGQTPDLIPRLREWIDALGGIIGETAPTVDRLKAILADLLRERACLLIADDVWKKAHARDVSRGWARAAGSCSPPVMLPWPRTWAPTSIPSPSWPRQRQWRCWRSGPAMA